MYRIVSGKKNYLVALIIVTIMLLPLPIEVSPTVQDSINQDNKIAENLSHILSSLTEHQRVKISVRFQENLPKEVIEANLVHLLNDDFEMHHIFHIIPVATISVTSEQVLKLAKENLVHSIMPETTRSISLLNATYVPSQSGGNNGYVHSDIILGTEGIWNEGYDGSDMTVAILDTGIMGDHPDLVGKLSGFYDLVNDESDMNETDGIDAYDDEGHGTACAWLVSGSGVVNGGKYTGMAPGADILGVKVLDSTGAGDDSIIAEGIEFAVDEGVDIISLSLGGDWSDGGFIVEPSTLAAKAAVEAGVTVVIAAGNSGPAAMTINSPGIVDETITVGSSRSTTEVVSFSSRGPVVRTVTEPVGYYAKPDILAPGLYVFSGIWPDANTWDYPRVNTTQYGNTYTLWSGTSASAPQIAGLVALLLDKHPSLTPTQVKAFLMAGSTDLGLDAMEQGYGIGNVTESSRMIEETSGSIAIMTPLRYPTLPGTSQVFIFGDERPNQSITVISTSNYGVADVRTVGNASEFIDTVEEFTISIGHSFFKVDLEVPENLPLSAVGHYTGHLQLVQNNTAIASMELVFDVTTYGGGMIVDMGHHSAEDPDDISNYNYFSEYLRKEGFVTSEYPENWDEIAGTRVSFDSSQLSTTEVLMIMDTELAYLESEVQAVHSFVEAGGILLILSEGFDSSASGPAFAFDSYNEILAPYGIQCERNWIGEGGDIFTGEVYGVDYGGTVENHSLTDGVENLYILNGGTFSVDPSVAGAEGLVWTTTEKEYAIVAYAQSGKGKVIAVSDGSLLYDTTVYDAALSEADNLNLLRNIAKLIIPDVPRISELEIQYGEIGENAEITAYVFDETLLDVLMTVTRVDDQPVSLTVTESLGYKFQATFLLERAGFYNVTIIASDAEGNMKIVKRSILIPVEGLDPELSFNVMIILLGVVGVALGYVAFLKFGGKRKIKRVTEREWEPQWESDGSPPSIE